MIRISDFARCVDLRDLPFPRPSLFRLPGYFYNRWPSRPFARHCFVLRLRQRTRVPEEGVLRLLVFSAWGKTLFSALLKMFVDFLLGKIPEGKHRSMFSLARSQESIRYIVVVALFGFPMLLSIPTSESSEPFLSLMRLRTRLYAVLLKSC